MAEYKAPTLVMGHIEVIAPDGEMGIPYDEAIIHLEGDEDSEIEIRCPGALRLAPLIVKGVNNHDALVKALKNIVDANNEFLKTLPEDWEGDPLQDACFEAAKLLAPLSLSDVGNSQGSGK